MPKIIAITGPSGAGKTTIAEEFTKRNKSFSNIDVDHLKHMNPNAFTKIIDEDGDEDFPYSAWGLLGKNVALLAQSFLDSGLNVIINGYLEVESWQEIEKLLKLDHKFLLLPDEATNIKRNSQRTKEVKMCEKAVRLGQKYFRKTEFYEDFITLDTTHQTVDMIIDQILKYI